MLARLGRPIVSTSANLTGEPAPAKLPEVAREILDGVDLVVSPRYEGKPTGRASAIILFNEDASFRIIRE